MKINRGRHRALFFLLALFLAALGIPVAFFVWRYSRSQYSSEYFRRAYEFSREGQWSLAVQYYTKSISLSPQSAVAYYNRGVAYLNEKEIDMAIKDFTMAIKLKPTKPWPVQYRGIAYEAKGDLSNAIVDFSRAIELEPNNPTNYYRRGFIYAVEKRWDNAISNYSAAIQLDSNNAAYFQGTAYAYFQKREPAKAVDNYEKAIQLAPEDPSILNSLAWFLAVYPDVRIRDGKKAVGLAEKACRNSRWDSWYCIGTLAAACAESGDYPDAVKYQKEAMLLNGPTEKEKLEEQQRLDLFQQHQAFHETP